MKARKIGRRIAAKSIRKVDKLFHPRRMVAGEAKVIFHPVDYLVFRGMKDHRGLRDLAFLDRTPITKDHRRIQHSIQRAIDKGRVRWATIRVDENGAVKLED